MLSLIVARDQNGAIGLDGDMPWHLPEDLKFFQRETMGGAVIMGRRTWESLPDFARPLKNRLNIVLSSGAPAGAENVVTSVEAAMDMARAHGHARIYGMGGASIYRAMMPLADRLVITEIGMAVQNADTWFPEFSAEEWREGERIVLQEDGPRLEAVEWLSKEE